MISALAPHRAPTAHYIRSHESRLCGSAATWISLPIPTTSGQSWFSTEFANLTPPANAAAAGSPGGWVLLCLAGRSKVVYAEPDGREVLLPSVAPAMSSVSSPAETDYHDQPRCKPSNPGSPQHYPTSNSQNWLRDLASVKSCLPTSWGKCGKVRPMHGGSPTARPRSGSVSSSACSSRRPDRTTHIRTQSPCRRRNWHRRSDWCDRRSPLFLPSGRQQE